MKKVLVTSFEPFAGRGVNVSADVAKDLREKLMGLTVEFGTLPVTYGGAFPALKRLVDQSQPRLLILLGEAVGSPGLRLERYAHNFCFSSTPDNDGVIKRGEKVEVAGPECLVTTLPLPELLTDAKMNISFSAGGFVCNLIYYQALLNFSPKIECLFIHVTDRLTVPEQAEMIAQLLRNLTLSD